MIAFMVLGNIELGKRFLRFDARRLSESLLGPGDPEHQIRGALIDLILHRDDRRLVFVKIVRQHCCQRGELRAGQQQVSHPIIHNSGVKIFHRIGGEAQFLRRVILHVGDVRQAQKEIGGDIKKPGQLQNDLVGNLLVFVVFDPAQGGILQAGLLREFFYRDPRGCTEIRKPLAYSPGQKGLFVHGGILLYRVSDTVILSQVKSQITDFEPCRPSVK